MARPRSQINVVCQNKNCNFFRIHDGKDIIKRGINSAGNRQYFCKHCNTYFTSTKGTPLYCSKLDERKYIQLCKELVEKKGIRSTSRTSGIDKNTISEFLRKIANHAEGMTTMLVKDLGVTTYEMDELLTIVKKNLRGLDKKQISSLNLARQLLQQL